MKTHNRTTTARTRTASDEHPWRATGLEAPVFADPSGRRALTMGGLGLTMAVATLVALAIVVTAAFGFTNVPSLRLSHLFAARPAPLIAHRIDHHPDRRSFASLTHGQSSARATVSDAIADRHAHA